MQGNNFPQLENFLQVCDRIDMMHELLEKELTVRSCMQKLNTSIECANFELFSSVIDNVDINTKDPILKESILHKICADGLTNFAELLLSKGALVDIIDSNGWTPLHSACSHGHFETILLLLKNDASPTALSKDGCIPLHYFTRCPLSVTDHALYVPALQKLLERDPQLINYQNSQGETPIHIAAFRGNKFSVGTLLKNSAANVNIGNQKGETPLHYAIRARNKGVVEELLSYGANPLYNTPLLLAIKENIADIISILQNHISRVEIRNSTSIGDDDDDDAQSSNADVPSFRFRDEFGFPIARKHEELYFQQDAKKKRISEEALRIWKRYLSTNNVADDIRNNSLQFQKLMISLGLHLTLRADIWYKIAEIRMKRRATDREYSYLVNNDNFIGDKGVEFDIEKDLRRTFPGHSFFESDLTINSIRRILIAYSRRNPGVGYCQSMNYIAGFLLLLMPEERTFHVLSYIIESLLVDYFRKDMIGLAVDQKVIEFLIEKKAPRAFEIFNYYSIPFSIFTTKWLMCLFLNTIPTDAILRVWDGVLEHGSKLLILLSFFFFKQLEFTFPNLFEFTSSRALIEYMNDQTLSFFDGDLLIKSAIRFIVLFNEYNLDHLRSDCLVEVISERQQLELRRQNLRINSPNLFSPSSMEKLDNSKSDTNTFHDSDQSNDVTAVQPPEVDLQSCIEVSFTSLSDDRNFVCKNEGEVDGEGEISVSVAVDVESDFNQKEDADIDEVATVVLSIPHVNDIN